MLKENCVEGLRVKILNKTHGESIENIGSVKEGIIETNKLKWVNVIPAMKNVSYCFNTSDIEPIGIYHG